MDICYKQPIANISYVSQNNEITIKFSEKIKYFNPAENTDYSISISGPLSPYSFSVKANFTDSSTLYVVLSVTSQMKGNNNEMLSISLDQSKFVSENEASLYNSKLTTPLYKVSLVSSAISSTGTGMNAAMTTTIAAVISSNVMLQQSSSLLWGFLSTIQIIYFFPLLSLYYPDNLSTIMSSLSSSRLKFSISQIDAFKSNLKSEYHIEENIGMPALNDQYESLDYNSTSLLINSEDMLSTIFQGLFICILIYGIRAIWFTVRANSDMYDNDLNEIENNETAIIQTKVSINEEDSKLNKTDDSTASPIANGRKILEDLDEIERIQNASLQEIKLKKWFKKKIKDISYEYKFNFFLRVGNQVYLEASILTLLNLRYSCFENLWQIISFLLSILSIILLICYFLWAINIGCKNYKSFRNKEKVDIREYESLFGEYRTQNMPQFLFNTFFMSRRMLYACIIIFLIDYPQAQAFLFLVICSPVLAFHLVMNPYIALSSNIIMNINEFTFAIIGYIFFAFVEPPSNTSIHNILGWIVIAIILSITMLNVIVIWIVKIIQIRKEITDWCKAYKLKRSIEKKKENENEVTEQLHFDSRRFVRRSNRLSNQLNTPSNLSTNQMSPCSDLSFARVFRPSQFLKLNMEEQKKLSNRENEKNS